LFLKYLPLCHPTIITSNKNIFSNALLGPPIHSTVLQEWVFNTSKTNR
jgi:hypothetical protein